MNPQELLQILESGPTIHPTAIVLPQATVIGDVRVGKHANIWFGAVLRGDTASISVGENSNIQDNAVLHADPGSPCTVGDNCVVGHSAIVHGATLENHVLVGMHATVLNDAVVGEGSIIGANALVTAGMQIPPFSLVLGVPGKIVKTLTEKQILDILQNVEEYKMRAKTYRDYFNSQRK